MSEKAEEFYERIADAASLSKSDLVDFFVYFLIVEQERASATAGEINRCFDHCHLPPYARLPQYLSENTRGAKPRFIKAKDGYGLSRHRREEIRAILGASVKRIQAGGELRKLLEKVPDGQRKDFLSELVTCFEVGANRATVIMCWILAMDCLFDHIFSDQTKLSAFNMVLSTSTDKRVKAAKVSNKDDFSDIPEGKFIEFCRSAKIISADVRKILDEKLGTRNSCAHPSGIKIAGSKALEFVEDLVQNVVLKYFA